MGKEDICEMIIIIVIRAYSLLNRKLVKLQKH